MAEPRGRIDPGSLSPSPSHTLLPPRYQVPDLKLNLKFEIEVLAKTLKVELTEVMSSKRLAMRTQDRTQTCDFANRAGALAAGLGGGLTSGFGGGLGSGSMMGVGGGTFAAGGAGGMGIPGCGACDASAPPFGAQMSAGQLGSFGQAPPPPPPPPGSRDAPGPGVAGRLWRMRGTGMREGACDGAGALKLASFDG